MQISIAKTRNSTKWKTETTTWESLVSRLGRFTRTSETMQEYQQMSKENRGKAKDVGGFVGGALNGGRRLKGAVVNRWLVTLDADNAYPGFWEEVMMLWSDKIMCCYSTHSSTKEKPRYRIVIPLSRAVTPEEFEPISRMLGDWIAPLEAIDPTSHQIERMMYFPSCSKDADPEFYDNEGELFDPDQILAEYGPGDAWKNASLWPVSSKEAEVHIREVKKQGDPLTKDNEVGLFCRAYSIENAMDDLIPGVYEPAGENRFTYTAGSTAAGAILYEDKFLYSHHATDPCGGRLVNAFDMVRIHKFGNQDQNKEYPDVTKSPSYQAMSDFISTLPKVKKQLVAEQLGDLADLPADAEADGGTEWETQLETKGGKLLPTRRNFCLILENDPRLKDCLRFNEFVQAPVRLRATPWLPDAAIPKSAEAGGVLWQDEDDSGSRMFIESNWGMDNASKLQDAVCLVSKRRSFHPVRDYLDRCRAEWDGKERLDDMLIEHMGAEGNMDYIRAVTRAWMIGAVKRIYEPGCQFDNMLVLTGPQGVGKSRLGRILSRGWFTDSLSKIENCKDSFEGLEGTWIVEIGELAAFQRCNMEAIKNFISKEKDKYRKAYGRRPGEYPRQCVFYGTTNHDEFLRDSTGARRFWPVAVKGKDRGRLQGLTDDVVAQLWGEAVAAYKAGELCMLSDEMELAAEKEQDRYAVQDQIMGEVEVFLDRLLPEDWYSMGKKERHSFFVGEYPVPENECTLRRAAVCIAEVRWELYGKEVATSRGNDTLSGDIGRALRRLGWKREAQARTEYGRQVMYIRPDQEETDAA